MSPRTNGPKCGADTGHGPCGNPAGMGTRHGGYGQCKFHLGNAPNQIVHARRVQAAEAAERFGLRVYTTPAQALQAELERSAGIVEFLVARCAELGRTEMVHGVTERRFEGEPRPDGDGFTTFKAQENVWLGLLYKWVRHHAEVAAVMAKLDLGAQELGLAAELGDRLADAVDGALTGAGLTFAQRADVLALLPARLEEEGQ